MLVDRRVEEKGRRKFIVNFIVIKNNLLSKENNILKKKVKM